MGIHRSLGFEHEHNTLRIDRIAVILRQRFIRITVFEIRLVVALGVEIVVTRRGIGRFHGHDQTLVRIISIRSVTRNDRNLDRRQCHLRLTRTTYSFDDLGRHIPDHTVNDHAIIGIRSDSDVPHFRLHALKRFAVTQQHLHQFRTSHILVIQLIIILLERNGII